MSSRTLSKNAGFGLATPSASLMATTSTSMPSAPQLVGADGRLVGDDRDLVAALAQCVDGSQRVGIEVLGAEPAVGLLHRFQPQRPVIEAEDPEDRLVLASPGDDGAEGREEREARDAELIRPRRPDPCLVDEGLADVEADPTRRVGHAGSVAARRAAPT